MTDTLFADVSEFQVDVNSEYPYRGISIRSSDGTYRDHHFAYNLAWAKHQCDVGAMDFFLVYFVWENDPADDLATARSCIGVPHPKMALMIDVESWGRRYSGDHSASINTEREAAISWLGSRKRVTGYGNVGDLNSLWPTRHDTGIILANYSANPPFPNKIAHQYADNFTVPPFGPCDINSADGVTPQQFAAILGVATLPPAPPQPAGDRLVAGQSLPLGSSIIARDGSHHLTVQHDGNMVLYNNGTGRAVWQTRTAGKDASRLSMQTDGNLVLYDTGGKPLWASRTAGEGADRVVCQTDGNLVMYAGTKPVWDTRTGGH